MRTFHHLSPLFTCCITRAHSTLASNRRFTVCRRLTHDKKIELVGDVRLLTEYREDNASIMVTSCWFIFRVSAQAREPIRAFGMRPKNLRDEVADYQAIKALKQA